MKQAQILSTVTKQTALGFQEQYPRKYDLLVLGINSGGGHGRHLTNMGCKTYQYINSQAVPVNGTHHKYMTANGKTAWLLLDGDGVQMVEKGYPTNYLIDLGNFDCRVWRANRIKGTLVDYGITGVFLDVVCSYYYSGYYADLGAIDDVPVNPRTGIDFTNPEWRQMFLDFITELAATGTSIYINTIGMATGRQYYVDSAEWGTNFTPYVDYILIEGFTRWEANAIDAFRTEANWQYDINLLSLLGDKAVAHTYVNVAATITQLDQWFNYGVASYLLGCTTASHFIWREGTAHGLAKDYWPIINDYFTRLGTPTESFTDIAGAKARLSGGVNTYHRAFSNGIVLVNPTASNDAAVELGGTYYDLAGTSYASVAMNAHTGLVLLATAL